MTDTSPLPLVVAAVLIGYLVYSVWSAYSTGVNKGMMKRTQMKGIVQYGPYLSLLISFFGVMIVVFILYELAAYYNGFFRGNLPANLAQLDFFTILYRQFTSPKLDYRAYDIFLSVGLVLSCVVSVFVVRFLYSRGLRKGHGPQQLRDTLKYLKLEGKLMADPLSLSTYVVQRQFKFGGLTLQFMDSEGNQVLKSQGKMIVTQQPLQTMDGSVISTITHKIVALSPEYDIHAGDAKGEVTGIVKEPMQLMSGFGNVKIDIKDGSGKVLATASGNFMDMEIDIVDDSGKAVAKVTRKLDASGILGKLSQYAKNSYMMTITGKSVKTQTLLEFLIVLELLLEKGRGSNPGVIRGIPGVGGGGGPIQF